MKGCLFFMLFIPGLFLLFSPLTVLGIFLCVMALMALGDD